MEPAFKEIVEGMRCAECYSYFSEDGKNIYKHGHPVVCKACAKQNKISSSFLLRRENFIKPRFLK